MTSKLDQIEGALRLSTPNEKIGYCTEDVLKAGFTRHGKALALIRELREAVDGLKKIGGTEEMFSGWQGQKDLTNAALAQTLLDFVDGGE